MMSVWLVLEPYVAELKLVNPYFIKQLPGKKSDVKDAEWIATCLLKDLIKGSYVPADIIQQLRQYDRRIFDLNAECVRKLCKFLLNQRAFSFFTYQYKKSANLRLVDFFNYNM